jgi:AraC-like DNA-binding protein
LEILYALAAGVSLCLCVNLFITSKENSKHLIFLAVLMLFFSIILLSASIHINEDEYHWKKYDLFVYWLYYACCPLFYFFLKSISTPNFKFAKKYILHFLFPIAMLILICVAYFSLPNNYADISAWTNKPFGKFFNKTFYLLYPFMFIYLISYWYLIYKHQKTIYHLASDADRRNLIWMIYFLIAITAMFIFLIFTEMSGYLLDTFIDPVFYLVCILFIGIHALNQPFVYADLETIEDDFLSTISDNMEKETDIIDEKLILVKNKLLEYFEINQPYLDNKITLPKLANQLGISHHLLSEVINKTCNENFFQFVNRYRVEFATRLLKDKKYAHFTIEAIGYEVGFNSKTTFNTTFKKIKGKSPSEFQKE